MDTAGKISLNSDKIPIPKFYSTEMYKRNGEPKDVIQICLAPDTFCRGTPVSLCHQKPEYEEFYQLQSKVDLKLATHGAI